MAELQPFGKYSTSLAFYQNTPAWVPPEHRSRVAAYALYRHLYWLHLDSTYKVMNRGLDEEDRPVYVPSSRIIINTMHRYTGPDAWFKLDPEMGDEQQQMNASAAFRALFTRERFRSRYSAAKREGLITGDVVWHIIGDTEKLEGSRLSLIPLKPDSYFPTYEDEVFDGGDPDKLVAVRLVEPILVGQDERVRVQLYERDDAGQILSSLSVWKPEEWYDPEKTAAQQILPPTPLPSQITSFPVYHVPTGYEVGEVFGSSMIRGLELIQAALNQGMTDEDLALALMGLGVFATDEAGGPVDREGNATPWMVYPGVVIERAKGLRRVEGITSVQAYNDHLGRLESYMADATGATDAARGRLEVAEAESGIALQLKLGPTLAMAGELEQVIRDVMDQMFYDLATMWFPAYEGQDFSAVSVTVAFGDKLPINRQAEAELVSGLYVAGLMSGASARKHLAARGFEGVFDTSEAELILAEKVATAAAEGGDPQMDRESTEEESALGSSAVGDE